MHMHRYAVAGALLFWAGTGYADRIEIPVLSMQIERGRGPYPEVRAIPQATGGKVLVWGATVADNEGVSATAQVSPSAAPPGEYTLWIRQSYSDGGAFGFTGIEIEVNGKRQSQISGPRGELYYKTSLEKFYWTPVRIGSFNGGTIRMTRDASGGGFVSTDIIVLTRDETWQPEGYDPVGRFPKTVATLFGPPIQLASAGDGPEPKDFFLVEAEAMTIDRAGAGARTLPQVQKDSDRWGAASGGVVVGWECRIDEKEAKKAMQCTLPAVASGSWYLWVRIAHGLPEKDIALGLPPATEDTGFYVIAGGKTYGPIRRPPAVAEWNDFFWTVFELQNFSGGEITFVRKTGGGWLWFDAIILTARRAFTPR